MWANSRRTLLEDSLSLFDERAMLARRQALRTLRGSNGNPHD